jgi:uncharacterized protein (TIGR02246 family)
MRLIELLAVGLMTLLPAGALAGPAEDASAIVDRWAASLGANDVDAVLKLYTSDALVHGISSPKLCSGSGAIREYFKTAPESGNKVTIGERHMAVLADAAVMGVGFYQVNVLQDGVRVPRSARFTFVMVKRGSDWLIAHHHSSTVPPAPLQ